jgi:hypothetical protein
MYITDADPKTDDVPDSLTDVTSKFFAFYVLCPNET